MTKKEVDAKVKIMSDRQNEIKRDLGFNFEYPDNQDDRDKKKEWFKLQSSILDLINGRKG